jgi:hypothetical protein
MQSSGKHETPRSRVVKTKNIGRQLSMKNDHNTKIMASMASHFSIAIYKVLAFILLQTSRQTTLLCFYPCCKRPELLINHGEFSQAHCLEDSNMRKNFQFYQYTTILKMLDYNHRTVNLLARFSRRFCVLSNIANSFRPVEAQTQRHKHALLVSQN